MEKTAIDIEKWSRKEHFKFFKDFTEPFFGVTVEVDCTKAWQYAKKHEHSFFLYYLHKSLSAINEIEELAYRVEGDQVVHYSRIDPAPTIGREDGTFGFAYFPYQEDFSAFQKEALSKISEVKKSRGLLPGTVKNVVYYSTLPWLNFTSLSHARDYKHYDSVPKISFGQLRETNGKRVMPMSVHVNHALADGYHVGKYVSLFQQYLDNEA